jgi:bacillolysin
MGTKRKPSRRRRRSTATSKAATPVTPAMPATRTGVRVAYSRGVRASSPKPLTAAKLGARASARTGAGKGRRAVGAGASNETLAQMMKALQEQELEPTHALDLTPAATTRRLAVGKRSSARVGGGAPMVALDVDVRPTESAVVLIEQEGEFSWHFPEPAAGAHGARRRGKAASAGAPEALGPTVVRIPVRMAPGSLPVAGSMAKRRSLSIGSLSSKIRAVVLKFVVRTAAGVSMKFLERNARKGIVVMKGNDPEAWERVERIDQLTLPAGRPLRLMLWIHGTFSSTVGSFGALTATPDGRLLLQQANQKYDAVLGFDHATLSETPHENAVDLVERLGRFARAVTIDCVTYSRGGLVFRSLVEQLLPARAGNSLARLDQAIFVAVPNNGTLLAEPGHWRALVDLYTNLAAGAFALLRPSPLGGAVAGVFSGLLSGLGALVKFLADVVVSKGAVPGLAAMQAKGEFIRRLNASGPAQPLPATTRYMAVTANFDARAARAGGRPTGLAASFLGRLADGLVDTLMKEKNDLVVNTGSMTIIDPSAGDFIDARLDFENSPVVYHTVYFAQPQLARQLRAWLLDDAARRGMQERRGLVTVRPSPRSPFTRVRYHEADGPAREVLARIGRSAARADSRAPALPRASMKVAAGEHARRLFGTPRPTPTAISMREEALSLQLAPLTARAAGGRISAAGKRVPGSPVAARPRSHAPTLEGRQMQVSTMAERDVHLISFAQTHADIPIFGTRVVMELDEGRRLIAARARLGRVEDVSNQPTLSPARAYAALTKFVRSAAPAGGGERAGKRPASQLTFFHDRKAARWHLAYLFCNVQGVPASWHGRRRGARAVRRPPRHCVGPSPRRRFARMDYLIDAHDGSLVYCYSVNPGAAKRGARAAMLALPTACSGQDDEGMLREFDARRVGSVIELNDPQRRIRTFDLGGGDIDRASLPRKPIAHTSHLFGALTPAGVSAHYYSARVFDFYNQVLLRKGIDDKGMELINVVNVTSQADEPPPSWSNAVWWQRRMWYGRIDKAGKFESFARHLDIIAHELTHGVTEATSNLVYRDESGALNESFSDIFGVIIKNWVRKGPDSDPAGWDWEIGAGLGGKRGQPLRSMRNPKRTGDPDHMRDFVPLPVEDDDGGVHTYSNIHNKAAYNLLTARIPSGHTRQRGARARLALQPTEVARVYYFTLQRLDRVAAFEDVLETALDIVKTMVPDPADQALKLAAVREAYRKVGIPRS